MTELLALTAQYLFSWAVLTISISWLSAAAYPFVKRHISTTGAVEAAFYTLLLAVLAPVVACITLIILSYPTLAQSLVAHHCHGEVCEPHIFVFVVETLVSSAALALGTAGVIFVAFLMGAQLRASRQRSHALEKLSELDTSGYLRFESPKRIAWCFGIFKPKVFISSGLLESLSEEQRQIILAHELAHASRHHNLRKWLLHWATLAWPKKLRGKIREDFIHLCDSICDLKAFVALNKTMEISTFVKTLKHFYGTQKSGANSTAGTTWQTRLKALQRELYFRQYSNFAIKRQSVMLGTITTLTSLLVVALSVFIGHPLLEALG